MEELLKNEAVRTKIKMLSPPVRKSFIENLLDLYEQEAEEMIDLIEESRMELRGDYLSFSDETKSLRAESRQLEERRKESDKDKVYKKKGRNSRMADSRLSYVDEEINNKSIQHYLNKRGKRRPPAVDVNRSQSEDVTLETRPFSVFSMRSTRSLPTPVSNRTVEEEKDAVMKNLSSAHEQSEAERQRQIERVAQRREMRRQQKQTTEEKALELLEKAVEMDRRLAEKKKVQDQKLRDRLEDIKKKKEKERHELASESPAMRPTSSHRPLSAMRPPASGSTAKGDNIKPHHSDSNDISDSSRGRERSAISDEKHGSRSDKHGSRSARKDEKGSKNGSDTMDTMTSLKTRLAEKKKVQDQKLRDRLEDIKKKKEKERHELASESPAMRPTSSHRPLSASRPPASGSTAKWDNNKPHHSDSNDISDSSRGRERSARSDEKHGSRSDKHGSRAARKEEKGSSEKLSDYDFTIY